MTGWLAEPHQALRGQARRQVQESCTPAVGVRSEVPAICNEFDKDPVLIRHTSGAD
jgi:hypothetical protein